jgi:hypothetical protein
MKPDSLLSSVIELQRPGVGEPFIPVEPAEHGRALAGLWRDMATRGCDLAADEPDAAAVETRLGTVLFARRDDRLLAAIASADTSLLAARYELIAFFDQ